MAKCVYLIFGLSLCAAAARSLPDNGSFPDMETCLRSSVVHAGDEVTVEDLRRQCESSLGRSIESIEEKRLGEKVETASGNTNQGTGERFAMEESYQFSRFVLIPHKRNYILPVSYKKNPNNAPYIDNTNGLEDLKHAEVEFQLSIKLLIAEGVLNNGYLFFGYTNQTFWQFYNLEKSTPFRDTNQQPELILRYYNDWRIFGFQNIMNEFAINHQSNGQGGSLSRSWNRLTFKTVFEKGNLLLSLKPWYRLPEDEKESPDDARGDDNPDIEKYMGHFELTGAYKHNQNIYSIMLRNNLRSDNKGAVELSWSFPLYKRSHNLHGYIKYFNGYGHSLIDYNDHTQAIGLGFVFTDFF